MPIPPRVKRDWSRFAQRDSPGLYADDRQSFLFLLGVAGIVLAITAVFAVVSFQGSFPDFSNAGTGFVSVPSQPSPDGIISAAGPAPFKGMNYKDLAAASGLKQLKSDEVLFIQTTNPQFLSSDSPGATQIITLTTDSEEHAFHVNAPGGIVRIQGGEGVNFFVDPQLGELRSLNGNTAGARSAKNPEGITFENSTQKKKVIVEMNLPYDQYYSLSSSAAQIATKKAQFKTIVDRVKGLANSPAKELKIAGAVALEVNQAEWDALIASGDVKKIEENKIYQPTLDASPAFIGADHVWNQLGPGNLLVTGAGQVIAILDTGVDYLHPDLGGCFGPACKVMGGYDFVSEDPDPMDDAGHGTHVAATAAGKGTLSGIAPDAKIVAYRVCGPGGCYGDDILAAIDASTDPNGDGNPADHVDVANMSLGGPGEPDDILSVAVNNSVAAGVVHVIAAGNGAPTPGSVASPGTARDAITVAAGCGPHITSCEIAQFSLRGPVFLNGENLHKPDITAPGVLICAANAWFHPYSSHCLGDNTHARISGTSMATPHMAGVVALLLQANPNYTPAEVKQRLKTTAQDLGLTEDDQGAGLVDLVAAIPTNSQVSSSPSTWTVSTNPGIQTSVNQRTFQVTSVSNQVGIVTPVLQTPIPGVNVTFSPSTLNLSNLGSATLNVTITTNNNVALNGDYTSLILFQEGTVTRGGVPIYLTVSSTLTTSPVSDLDYGVDIPDLPSWDSGIKTIQVTNLRTDVAQNVTITPPSFPAGVTFTAPASITVPANSSVTVNTRIVVNNPLVPNGVYSSPISFTNVVNNLSVLAKFSKAYVLRVQNIDPASTGWMLVHDRTNTVFVQQFNNNTNDVLLPHLGLWDAIIYYGMVLDPTIPPTATAFGVQYKEGILIQAGTPITNVTAGRSQLTNTIHTIGTLVDGQEAVFKNEALSYQRYLPNPALYNLDLTRYGLGISDVSYDMVSNMSPAYAYMNIMNFPGEALFTNAMYYFAKDIRTGITNDLTISNTPSDFKTMRIEPGFSSTSNVKPAINYSLRVNGGSRGFSPNGMVGPAKPVTIFSLADTYPGLFDDAQILTRFSSNTDCTNCPSNIISPWFTVGAPGQSLRAYHGGLPNFTENKLFMGLGPIVWAGVLNGSPSLFTLSNGNAGICGFHRQDYTSEPRGAIPYGIFQNNVQVSTGTLGPCWTNAFDGGEMALPSFSVPNANLPYEFRLAQVPYSIKGFSQPMNASVTLRFNSSPNNMNPPSLRRLFYLSNDFRSEVYDSTKVNRIEFVLSDSDQGVISPVTVSYSTNGTNFTTVTATLTNGTYFATLPSNLSGFQKLSVRISASDAVGNNLTYTFELPAGTATAPDMTGPALSLTSPSNGASLTGTINVTANATDPSGINEVVVSVDNTFLAFDVTAPYSSSVNTIHIPNGSHSFSVKAFDQYFNSSTQTVTATVNNTPDTIRPIISGVTPTNGARIGGSSFAYATVTDNVEVQRVEFLQDGVVFATILPGAGTTYGSTWHTQSLADGPHTFTVKAYDWGHNSSGTQNTAQQTMNVTIDNTPPVISGIANTSMSPSIEYISWQLNESAQAQVLYGLSSSYGMMTPFTSGLTHSATLSGLVPGSVYHYQIRAIDAAGNESLSADRTFVAGASSTDTIPPTTSIVAPTNGSTVTGSIYIFTTVADNIGVTLLEFYRDNILIGSVTGSPFWLYWDTATVSNGLHVLTTKAYDAASNVGTSAPVSVTTSNMIADTQPPTVSITSPSNGATVSNTITITANATDNVSVAGVMFYLDGVALGTYDLTAPYTFTWNTTTTTNGPHVLTARAADPTVNIGISPPVNVTVSNGTSDTTAPTTSITSPANGATVSNTITITANASDNVAVTNVEFYRDGVLMGSDATSPYSFSWNTTSTTNGAHVLTTRAFDAANNFGNSAPVNVTVSNSVPDTQAPTTSITTPANNSTVVGSVNIAASASDNVGVTRVEFYVDSVLIGTDTTSPYTLSWNSTTTSNGPHVLTSRAFDAANNFGNSAPVNVTVSNGGGSDLTPPTVTITSPANNSQFSIGDILFAASAGDVQSGISTIQLKVNGVIIKTCTSSPCNKRVPVSSLNMGANTFQALATNGASLSSTASVTVFRT